MSRDPIGDLATRRRIAVHLAIPPQEDVSLYVAFGANSVDNMDPYGLKKTCCCCVEDISVTDVEDVKIDAVKRRWWFDTWGACGHKFKVKIKVSRKVGQASGNCDLDWNEHTTTEGYEQTGPSKEWQKTGSEEYEKTFRKRAKRVKCPGSSTVTLSDYARKMISPNATGNKYRKLKFTIKGTSSDAGCANKSVTAV